MANKKIWKIYEYVAQGLREELDAIFEKHTITSNYIPPPQAYIESLVTGKVAEAIKQYEASQKPAK